MTFQSAVLLDECLADHSNLIRADLRDNPGIGWIFLINSLVDLFEGLVLVFLPTWAGIHERATNQNNDGNHGRLSDRLHEASELLDVFDTAALF
ncbi:hypothetical protein Y032_0093g2614 [Ancylostoma ceylanicum]|uniref:Uncharacterized protein n=1 Tax=Ancylostoma ceylanicum TaxID=53326 RepID=A0A016TLQ8_9BILA|nr:hypothetical protein Y032_0093g2614 [Ancylostoma ceylanicum]